MATTDAIHAPLGRVLLHALARNWWMLLLRGICALAFGILAFVWPGMTLVTLILFYGAFAFVDGIFALVAAITAGAPAPRWWLAIVGLLGIAAGLATWLYPGLTALVLLYFIAVWAVVTGVMQIAGAIQVRKAIDNEWFLIGVGVLSVLFGVLLILQPGTGALAVLFTIGSFAVLYGMLMIAFALRLRPHAHVAA
jgi:uncharacterized membrane protein HdeD (DUF308 family)